MVISWSKPGVFSYHPYSLAKVLTGGSYWATSCLLVEPLNYKETIHPGERLPKLRFVNIERCQETDVRRAIELPELAIKFSLDHQATIQK